MKFAEDRVDMLEAQLVNAGIDFTPDYYKRIKISYKIAEDRVKYRNKKHARNVAGMLADIRKEEKEWDKKPVKRRPPKVFKYSGKNGEEEELEITDAEKDAWLKRYTD